MPVCVVSFTDTESVYHSIEIEAHSLYEAAASALAEFRATGMVPLLGPGTRLQIAVRRPETLHELRVEKVETWLSSNAKSPAEQAVKVRLREAMK